MANITNNWYQKMGQEEAKRLSLEEVLAEGPINVLDKPRNRTPTPAPQQQAAAPTYQMPTVAPITDMSPAGIDAWNRKLKTPREMQKANEASGSPRGGMSRNKTKSRF